jgi:probable F420-dependent oxidoreductase
MAECHVDADADGGAFVDPARISAFAQTLEASGFDAIAFTDHPAPSSKWLEAGGHHTFDPFVALAHTAASTTTLRLMTHLLVVPYRNPFLQARSMMTLDVLSAGRATFVLGTGYLRSEFGALGVDFERRNEIFDEAMEIILRLWSGVPVVAAGEHFSGLGQVMRPLPVQRPRPPLWIGGNSRVALDRIAAWADGWAVLTGPPDLPMTARTRAIRSDTELAAMIANLRERAEAGGRDPGAIDVMVTAPAADLRDDLSARERLTGLERLAAAGVTWIGVTAPRDRHERSLAAIREFGRSVIEPLRSKSGGGNG